MASERDTARTFLTGADERVHRACLIALEYLQMIEGRSPLRPLEDCDLPDRPCRWFIYKDPERPRAVHYERMGFTPPDEAPR